MTRVINTAHVLKHPPPLSATPTKAARTNILGLGNNANGVMKDLPEDLEKCVPKWGSNVSMRSHEPLLSIDNRKGDSVRAGANNPCRWSSQRVRKTVNARRPGNCSCCTRE